VDASTMEANATLRTIVRREDGRTYREMLTQMARESGIDTPTADDLVRLDRARKGKTLSNEEWASKTDPQAMIAKLKDGRAHLAYKPEHAVDAIAVQSHRARRASASGWGLRSSGRT
jgi:transposase